MPDVVLSQAQYGKAEVRLLHVDRSDERHEITDLNVTITLAGDLPPYGLIEGAVQRAGAPPGDPGHQW